MPQTALTTAQQYLKDTRKHHLHILHDEGLYRHLVYSSGSAEFRVEIITSPGKLFYVGDMGSYAFERNEDMLAFFNHSKPNPGYWSTKVVAQDICCPVRSFDRKSYESDIINMFWEARADYSFSEARELWQHVLDDIISPGPETLDEALELLSDYNAEHKEIFDTSCSDFTAFTHHFQWACHAIQQVATQYWQLKAN